MTRPHSSVRVLVSPQVPPPAAVSWLLHLSHHQGSLHRHELCDLSKFRGQQSSNAPTLSGASSGKNFSPDPLVKSRLLFILRMKTIRSSTDCLEDWNCKNHQIITWFHHSTIPTINQQFGRYDNAKDVWVLLSRHYTTTGLSDEYQLWGLLVNMKQTPKQPINEFLFGPSSYSGICYESTSLMRLVFAFFNPIILMWSLLLLLVLLPYLGMIDHIVYNCPTKPPKPGQFEILPRPVNHSVVVVAEKSPSNPSLSSISVTLGILTLLVVIMSLDFQLFSYIIPTTYAPLIQTANGLYIIASHTGSVSTSTLSISDTYLILNLTLNLISVDQLCELGFDLWFSSSGCHVQDPRTNQVLGTGRRVGQMFELTSLYLPSTPTSLPSHVAHTTSVFPLSLWHLRLAALTAVYTINRLPSSALQNLSPFERLYGLNIKAIVVGILSLSVFAFIVMLFSGNTPHSIPSPNPSAILPIPPADSPVSPLAPPPAVDLVLYQTSLLPPATPPDLPFTASPAESPISPQELAPFVDSVTDQTSLLPLRRSDRGKYASDLLSHAGLTDTKVLTTPLEMNARLTPLDGTPLSDATLYRQLVGSLVYLTVTHPDIAHAAHLVSQFLAALHSTHYAAMLHILRYIKGTMFHGLHFSAHATLYLCAYFDTNLARDPTDRRSTTGFCFFLGDSLISWHSKKQHIVSCSSTKAECCALVDTTSELFALHWSLEDMGLIYSSPTVIHCDNRSTIQIAHNDVFHVRTKNIEIDCHLVRHYLSVGILRILSVSSSNQTADIFMKTFPPGCFRDLIFKLKMASVKPP
uniref:Reverse transcriptase Ty1/copia-type domain-containing protein n=1 Tax=Fagus sylvatica TaxID=28930 RepID=A0A2N9ISW1_FAGSY